MPRDETELIVSGLSIKHGQYSYRDVHKVLDKGP